jgi:hypothetical protein
MESQQEVGLKTSLGWHGWLVLGFPGLPDGNAGQRNLISHSGLFADRIMSISECEPAWFAGNR